MQLPDHRSASDLAFSVCQAASTRRCDDIIVGSRGNARSSHAVDKSFATGLGSVSNAIAHMCSQPVILIKKPDSYALPPFPQQ